MCFKSTEQLVTHLLSNLLNRKISDIPAVKKSSNQATRSPTLITNNIVLNFFLIPSCIRKSTGSYGSFQSRILLDVVKGREVLPQPFTNFLVAFYRISLRIWNKASRDVILESKSSFLLRYLHYPLSRRIGVVIKEPSIGFDN